MSVLVMSRSIMDGTDKGAGQLLNHGSQDLRIGAANAPLFYFLRAHPPIPHMLCAVPNTQIYDILDSRNRIGLRSEYTIPLLGFITKESGNAVPPSSGGGG